MNYVYVLKNPKSQAIYIGFSADLRQRIQQHEPVSIADGNSFTTRPIVTKVRRGCGSGSSSSTARHLDI